MSRRGGRRRAGTQQYGKMNQPGDQNTSALSGRFPPCTNSQTRKGVVCVSELVESGQILH